MPTSPVPTLSGIAADVHAERAAAAGRGRGRLALRIVGGSLLMALAAHVAVPFWPVPLTLQTLAVLGLGAAFGPAAAFGAMAAWIAEGLVGLPVFATGAGPGVLLGPTGGYVLGTLPMALLAGLAARPGRRGSAAKTLAAKTLAAKTLAVRTLAAFLTAEVVLFVCGVLWLARLIGWGPAVSGGLTPFLLGEALKVGLATAGTLALARRRS